MFVSWSLSSLVCKNSGVTQCAGGACLRDTVPSDYLLQIPQGPGFSPSGIASFDTGPLLSFAANIMATQHCNLPWKEDPGCTKSATKLPKDIVICPVGSYLYLW